MCLYAFLLQVNITLQAWDRGDPEQSSLFTIPLDIITYSSMGSGQQQTVTLEINEQMPAGIKLAPQQSGYRVT